MTLLAEDFSLALSSISWISLARGRVALPRLMGRDLQGGAVESLRIHAEMRPYKGFYLIRRRQNLHTKNKVNWGKNSRSFFNDRRI